MIIFTIDNSISNRYKQGIETEITMSNVTPMMINDFMIGCKAISDANNRANGYRVEFDSTFEAQPGKRYVRIVRRDVGQGSAHAFIDLTNGDVLKPEGWKKPAKHARGNLFDEKKGLGAMGPYGPAYLR